MTRTVYVPPAGDEPLDEIELALVRLLVDLWAPEIRAELEAEARDAASPAAVEVQTTSRSMQSK